MSELTFECKYLGSRTAAGSIYRITIIPGIRANHQICILGIISVLKYSEFWFLLTAFRMGPEVHLLVAIATGLTIYS